VFSIKATLWAVSGLRVGVSVERGAGLAGRDGCAGFAGGGQTDGTKPGERSLPFPWFVFQHLDCQANI